MFANVLFSVDQSREAREAANVVANIVKTYNSRLTILSVVERDETSEAEPGVMSSEAEVAKLLQGAKALFSQQGIEAEIIEKVGKPSFVICDVADEMDANLIVMGCRGIGLTEGATESVTNLVINLAPCPVLIVP